MLLFNSYTIPTLEGDFLISKHLMLLFNGQNWGVKCRSDKISKHLMLLFNGFWRESTTRIFAFQNISCYCLTIEKTSFFNFFFQKNNDFIIFFNVFTNHPFNFPLFQKTTYSSLSYYFFKKSLGKILITSFIFSFQTLPIMNPINQICNHNIQTNIQT